MASLTQTKNGAWLIRYSENRSPQTFYLGKFSSRAAEEVFRHFERILEARFSHIPLPPTTAEWLGAIDSSLRQKLESKGLVQPAAPAARRVTIGDFLKQYEEQRSSDLSPLSRRNLDQSKKKLLAYLGPDRELGAVTTGDMLNYRHWLATVAGLAPNTVKTHCRRAKQFFAAALGQGLTAENPCRVLKGLQETRNPDRERFMTPTQSLAVLEACPTGEWRVIFCLARFGGMRPSEILCARWEHVEWDRELLQVQGSKGRHGSGKRLRELPLFPEIRESLRDLRAERTENSGRVVLHYREGDNMGVQLGRIIAAAGLDGWERPFQNLRSTRATELVRMGVVIQDYCRWLGHTPQVALRHYLQTRPEDVSRAAALRTLPGADRLSGALQEAHAGACADPELLQKLIHEPARTGRREAQDANEAADESAITPGNSQESASVRRMRQSHGSADYPRQDSNL